MTACPCEDYEMFRCVDCAACTLCDGEYYMVHNEIWDRTGLDRGMLCIGCLEQRIGKLLTARDFTDAPINDIFGNNGSARLMARLQGAPQIT